MAGEAPELSQLPERVKVLVCLSGRGLDGGRPFKALCYGDTQIFKTAHPPHWSPIDVKAGVGTLSPPEVFCLVKEGMKGERAGMTERGDDVTAK